MNISVKYFIVFEVGREILSNWMSMVWGLLGGRSVGLETTLVRFEFILLFYYSKIHWNRPLNILSNISQRLEVKDFGS